MIRAVMGTAPPTFRSPRAREGFKAAAKAPAASTAPPNITAAMAKDACKAFLAQVSSSPDVYSMFKSVGDGCVMAFCPRR